MSEIAKPLKDVPLLEELNPSNYSRVRDDWIRRYIETYRLFPTRDTDLKHAARRWKECVEKPYFEREMRMRKRKKRKRWAMNDHELIRELIEMLELFEGGHTPESWDLQSLLVIAKARVCSDTRRQVNEWAKTGGSDD